MAINLDVLLIQTIVGIVIVSPVLWLSGRAFVGAQKAKFMDAVLIVVIGSVVGAIFGFFFVGLIAFIIQLLIWLVLVRHFFECGWLQALAISIVAVIIFVVIIFILAFIGIGILALL